MSLQNQSIDEIKAELLEESPSIDDKEYQLMLVGALSLPDEIHTNNAETSLRVLMHFSAAVNNGIQPDKRVMKAIANAFGNYICNHQIVGAPKKLKTLDDVFNLKPNQKSGHPIQSYVNRAKRFIFMQQMFKYREATERRGKKATIIESAEWALNACKINGKSLDIDADTLKRYYIKIGGDDFFYLAEELEGQIGI